MQFIKSLYIHTNFYKYITLIAIVFLVSFWWQPIYSLAWVLVVILVIATSFDVFLLYNSKKGIESERIVPKKFSNGDENIIRVHILNNYNFTVNIKVIDEIPIQFQKRDFQHTTLLEPNKDYNFEYSLTPYKRGNYSFGALNIYVSSFLKIILRRYKFSHNAKVQVYPSFIQMKKYEFLALNNKLTTYGLKKIRRIGHTLEFEQIKNYVKGDDARTINWKATAKRSQIMVNQYQDEKSQPIYSIIDLGRTMKMPFNSLKLLDYAINSTLAFSNIALRKSDKAGLVTFSKKVETILQASNKKTHLNVINEALYNISTNYTDSDFAMLYTVIKRKIRQRSLLLLYTNFEHISSLKRQLPYLKAISKFHALVVVIFKNTELDALVNNEANTMQEIYDKTIAEKFVLEKEHMVKELETKGIYCILTKPKDLTVNVINKYLTFKAKGII